LTPQSYILRSALDQAKRLRRELVVHQRQHYNINLCAIKR